MIDECRHAVVVLSYADTEKKLSMLRVCLHSVQRLGNEWLVILVSHHPDPPDIQSMADVYIYEQDNPVVHQRQYAEFGINNEAFYENDNYRVEWQRPYTHDYAVFRLMRLGFYAAVTDGRDFVHMVNYDCLVEPDAFRRDYAEPIEAGCGVAYTLWAEDVQRLMATYMISLSVDRFKDLFDRIRTVKDYYARPTGWSLESVFWQYCTAIGLEGHRNHYPMELLDRLSEFNKLGLAEARWVVAEDDRVFLHICGGKASATVSVNYVSGTTVRVDNNVKVDPGEVVLYEVGTVGPGGKAWLQQGDVKAYEEIIHVGGPNRVTFKSKLQVSHHFIKGAYCAVHGGEPGQYNIQILNAKTGQIISQDVVPMDHYHQINETCYYVPYQVRVLKDGKVVSDYVMDLKGQVVLISFESDALGDTVAWLPFVDVFASKHGCCVVCATFWNELFSGKYPHIVFVKPGTVVQNLYAQYCLGWAYHPVPEQVNVLPLAKISADILGLEFNGAVRPIIDMSGREWRRAEWRYAVISTYGRGQAKRWHHPGGWQAVIDHLNAKGLKVVVIQSEPMGQFNGDVRIPASDDIRVAAQWLLYAEVFIGLSSGISWLAWALGVPTVMISGFTLPSNEPDDVARIINTEVCHGCFNKLKYKWDRSWDYCPEHKGTPRQYECTKLIGPDKVLAAIDSKLIQE